MTFVSTGTLIRRSLHKSVLGCHRFHDPASKVVRPFPQPLAGCLFTCILILAAIGFHSRLQLVGNNLEAVSVNVFTIGSGMLSQRVDMLRRKLQVNVECWFLASILSRRQSDVIVFSQARWSCASLAGLLKNHDYVSRLIKEWMAP
jgi:hypothetical protein